MPRARFLFVLALAAGVILRVLHTATSLGSVDALLWYRWVELIGREGILRSYLFSDLQNHPPLVLALASALNRLGGVAGLEFQDSLRYFDCLADVVTALLLYRIGTRLGVPPMFAALSFFLSPAAIFVSAFHGNSDPILMMCVVLAVALALEGRPTLAGVALAAATGIKIVALLPGPLFLLLLRGRDRVRFLAAAIVAFLLFFLPGLLVSGPVFLKNVFGYAGLPTRWGFRLVAQALGVRVIERLPMLLLLVTLVAIWILAARRGAGVTRLAALTGLTYLLAIFCAPGFGLQYFFWMLPLLAFVVPRGWTLALHGVVSLYLFVYYTAWCGEWPWYYAETPAPPHIARPIIQAGLLPWALIGVAVALGLARNLSRGEEAKS